MTLDRPTIVCLCGSTRFWEVFSEAAKRETLAGKIVLTVHWGREMHDTPAKLELDKLHLRKIDLADEILVINIGGYIGYSTMNEIGYARSLGKKVRWWEHNVPLWKKTLNKARRMFEHG